MSSKRRRSESPPQELISPPSSPSPIISNPVASPNLTVQSNITNKFDYKTFPRPVSLQVPSPIQFDNASIVKATGNVSAPGKATPPNKKYKKNITNEKKVTN